MALSDITNNFGYTEMYEWDKDNIQEYPYGYFVEFGNTNKIVRANDPQKVIGVTTICSTTNISDNPNHWPKENIANEFGDVRVHKKQIVEGHKVYDDKDEFSYIKTSLKEKYVPNKTPMFKPHLKYIQRTARKEWTPVTLIGKCIVRDNGLCKPGDYCTVYSGEDKDKIGTAVPSENGWRVLDRYSNSTIMILYK